MLSSQPLPWRELADNGQCSPSPPPMVSVTLGQFLIPVGLLIPKCTERRLDGPLRSNSVLKQFYESLSSKQMSHKRLSSSDRYFCARSIFLRKQCLRRKRAWVANVNFWSLTPVLPHWRYPWKLGGLCESLLSYSPVPAPTLLFGNLRPDLTGVANPPWRGRPQPGAGHGRQSSPAAREQCSWFLHLLVGR